MIWLFCDEWVSFIWDLHPGISMWRIMRREVNCQQKAYSDQLRWWISKMKTAMIFFLLALSLNWPGLHITLNWTHITIISVQWIKINTHVSEGDGTLCEKNNKALLLVIAKATSSQMRTRTLCIMPFRIQAYNVEPLLLKRIKVLTNPDSL